MPNRLAGFQGKRHMRAAIVIIFLSLFGAVLCPASEQEKSPEEVLTLPTFKVSAAGFDIRAKFDLKTNKVLAARIMAVELLAYRDGLRSGDELLAVDGRPLAGLPVAEFGSLFTVPDGQPEKSFTLSVKHRLSLKPKEITVKFKSMKSVPAQPTETAPGK